MSELLSLTVIDRIKDRVHAFIADYRKRLKGCHYIDVRREISEANGGYAHNSTAKWEPAMRDAPGSIAAPRLWAAMWWGTRNDRCEAASELCHGLIALQSAWKHWHGEVVGRRPLSHPCCPTPTI